MKRLTKMHEVTKLDDLNAMLAQPERFRLWEHIVNGSEVRWFVGEMIEVSDEGEARVLPAASQQGREPSPASHG